MAGNLYTHFHSKVCRLAAAMGVSYHLLIEFYQYTFLVFIGIFELGSLICGLAGSSSMLIAGRAIAGLGASGIQNGIFMIVAGRIPLEKRACEKLSLFPPRLT